jgi:5'-nucleotidase (lipoprotein e(P4) family)
MRSLTRWLVVLLPVASLACGARTVPPVTTPAGAPPRQAVAGAASEPDSIRWVRSAAEYQAAVLQAYRQATIRVEAEAATRAAGSWAVILDADETVISNLTYQAERARAGLPYTPESWSEWVRRREATPLPGAAAFLMRVRTLGGRVAIVTNRLQTECEDTEAVFRRYTLPYDAMLCRPEGEPSDKNPRFEAVAAGRTAASPSPVVVVAFVGDNILDFPALTQASDVSALDPFGVRYFLIPNPMYGSWQ